MDEKICCNNEPEIKSSVFILLGNNDIDLENLEAIRSLIGCSNKDIIELKNKNGEGQTDWNYVLLQHMDQILEDSRIDSVILIDYRNGTPILEKYFPLQNLIGKAIEYRADFLLGNAIGIKMPIRVSRNLFWIDSFVHSEFIIVLRSNFSNFVRWLDSGREDDLIYHINNVKNKLLLYPYVYFTDAPVIRRNNTPEIPIKTYLSEMNRLSVINSVLDKFEYGR